MKAEDLRKLGAAEIEGHIRDLAQELFNMRFQHATGQLENTARLQSVRRDIARAKTVLTQVRKGEEAKK
ncbi:MAG: 50S ribosomal protein L29 [Candidatus Methylomirabilis sp.]|nr:50S ribosomal protein L29 [Deltaproteobacteria bacterium]